MWFRWITTVTRTLVLLEMFTRTFDFFFASENETQLRRNIYQIYCWILSSLELFRTHENSKILAKYLSTFSCDQTCKQSTGVWIIVEFFVKDLKLISNYSSSNISVDKYRTEGVTGTILVNRKASCYIQQEDCHHTLINVMEMMTMACRLKLKHSDEQIDQQSRINEILTGLNLLHRKTSTASTLSGGERKRLSIALELVTNPSIMFLDEPTSGLDEVTAASCIRLLRELAHQDRTIICTIHQPSAAMFDLFDNIYLLAQGSCVYQGSPKTLIPFLLSENFICPKYNFPADYSKLKCF